MKKNEEAEEFLTFWLFRRPICGSCETFHSRMKEAFSMKMRDLETLLETSVNDRIRRGERFKGDCPDCIDGHPPGVHVRSGKRPGKIIKAARASSRA